MFSLSVSLLFFTLVDPGFGKEATNKLFQWQFSNADGAISTRLPTCQELPVLVKSFHTDNSTHGKPPYYMTSFAVDSIPVTALIGADEAQLSWTVTHPVGSQLLLGVVDADGSSGGISPLTFTVVAGQSTQCVKPPAATNFQVTANVTDRPIVTCEPWGIRVKGGVPPYQLTLLQPNSPVVTNVSFTGPDDDAFTFIDRADTNGQIMAAISDFTGQWANGSVLVQTTGPANVDCIGLVSSSGNSTQLELDALQAKAGDADKKKRNNIIIGVVVPVVVLSLIAAGVWFFLRKRRGSHDDDLDTAPRQYRDEIRFQEQTQFIPVVVPKNHYTVEPFDPYASSDGGYTPETSAIRSSKAVEAASDAARRRQQESGTLQPRIFSADGSEFGSSTAGSSTGWGTTSTREPTSTMNSGSNYALSPVRGHDTEEIIIQHQDAGEPVVRELPPPYADRSNAKATGGPIKGPRKR